MINRPRNTALGSVALLVVLVLGGNASADPSAADAGKAKAEEHKGARAEQPKPAAAEAGTAKAAAAKEKAIADGKDTSPPTADGKTGKPGEGESEGEEGSIERRGPRRMNAAQESYRRAREKFLLRTSGENHENLPEKEKKQIETAQKALERARARLQASHKPSERMSQEQREAFADRLKALHEKRLKTREERTNEQRDKLKESFKDADSNPAIAAEFKHHAWRVARLLRLKELASAGDRPEALKRIEELMEKESSRHEKHLTHLREGGDEKDEKGKAHEKGSKKGALPPGAKKSEEKKEGAK